jgi:hypothetical protein
MYASSSGGSKLSASRSSRRRDDPLAQSRGSRTPEARHRPVTPSPQNAEARRPFGHRASTVRESHRQLQPVNHVARQHLGRVAPRSHGHARRDDPRGANDDPNPLHHAGSRMNRPPPHVHGKEGVDGGVRQRALKSPRAPSRLPPRALRVPGHPSGRSFEAPPYQPAFATYLSAPSEASNPSTPASVRKTLHDGSRGTRQAFDESAGASTSRSDMRRIVAR